MLWSCRIAFGLPADGSAQTSIDGEPDRDRDQRQNQQCKAQAGSRTDANPQPPEGCLFVRQLLYGQTPEPPGECQRQNHVDGDESVAKHACCRGSGGPTCGLLQLNWGWTGALPVLLLLRLQAAQSRWFLLGGPFFCCWGGGLHWAPARTGANHAATRAREALGLGSFRIGGLGCKGGAD